MVLYYIHIIYTYVSCVLSWPVASVMDRDVSSWNVAKSIQF